MAFDPDWELQFDLGLDEPDDSAALRVRAAELLGMSAAAMPPVELKKRAIDARRGRVRFHLTIGLSSPAPSALGGEPLREVSGDPVVIIGGGPAGLFCAYQLARVGIASIIVDRGKQVRERRRDLKGLTQRGTVDPDSNYCFGEGGAGTFSDGKLYTRAHKRGDVRDVIEILAVHGAPLDILVDARPHIGSNKLPKVVAAMRERLEAVGAQLRFGARVESLVVRDGAIRGVRLAGGGELAAREVVVAAGHSARDVFSLLASAGAAMEAKAFAMGVRIEHPQPLINQIQYGKAAGHPKLPAANYRLAHTPADGHGVFSFCMCPGGWIVPAATEPDGLVVNGMSLSRRDSPFANSGFVVGIELGDFAEAGVEGVFGGIELQRRIERAAAVAGGGKLVAPATRVVDFLAKRGSSTVPATSYVPGILATDVAEVLAASMLPLADRMRAALEVFGRSMRGYVTEEAVLVGVESRTSSPIRVLRDAETLASPTVAGLYPCGEGAGYAGGIVSAALDGIRVARAIARRQGKAGP